MGSQWSDESAKSDEKPQHTVYMGSFWIDQTEVTVRQYNLCIDAGQCSITAFPSADVPSDYYENSMYADYPAVDITWQGARAYCAWAGKRLPTETEWEKAARGTDGIIYPWGNNAQTGNTGNYCDRNCDLDWKDTSTNDGYLYRSPVGNYPVGASPYGALDMAGNVWEWVADWYGDTYYTSMTSNDPQGPGTGSERVVRGGGWGSTLTNLRTAKRFHRQPNIWFGDVGFRCAIDVDE